MANKSVSISSKNILNSYIDQLKTANHVNSEKKTNTESQLRIDIKS